MRKCAGSHSSRVLSVHVVPPPDRWTVFEAASEFCKAGSVFELLAAGSEAMTGALVVGAEPGPLSLVK